MSSEDKSKVPVEEQLRMIWGEIVSIIERLRKLEKKLRKLEAEGR